MVKTNLYISSSEISSARKILLKLLLLLPLVSLIVSVNYFVDPANLYYGAKVHNCVADLIAKGTTVSESENLDERLLQKKVIAQLSFNPKILILGSSRTMIIGRDFFGAGSVYNSSVSSATLKDWYGLYQSFLVSGITPKFILLGVDPWLLNEENQHPGWQSLETEVGRMTKRLFPDENRFSLRYIIPEKFFNIVSLSYFRTSIAGLVGKKREKLFRRDLICNESKQFREEGLKILPDGSKQWGSESERRTTKEVHRIALESAQRKVVDNMERFNELSDNLKGNFEEFVKFLLRSDIQVIIYLPPYHPATFQILKERPETKIFIEAEQYFRNTASALGVPIIGAYNPNAYGIVEGDFYDALHLKKDGIQKIFDAEKSVLSQFQ